MNKKILVISILAVFMLLAISMASALNTTISVKRKESPLFGIRTRYAIGDRLKDIREQIKTKFIGDRVFFLPFKFLSRNNIHPFDTMNEKDNCYDWTGSTYWTCAPTCGLAQGRTVCHQCTHDDPRCEK